MGSTGDRAASLMIGGAKHARGDGRLRAYRAACRPPLIRIINQAYAKASSHVSRPRSRLAGRTSSALAAVLIRLLMLITPLLGECVQNNGF